jgi:ATP-dependent DNA helicase RecQ
MATIEEALTALRRYFGFEDFREGQREVIASVLEGRDTVVVMPTGGGKSLCYQLPALMLDGATVVVSPLIALMKDQVDALAARQLPATFINSSIDFEEQKARLSGIRRGAHKLVYIAPERFRSAHFTELLRSIRIALFAVDEAHCISQWGHDFRPDYLRLKEAIETIGRPQVIALTATATPHVREDIIAQLALREPRAFVTGFDRPNLTLDVIHTQKEHEKIARIKALARQHTGSGIVYTSTRKAAEQVAGRLQAAGLSVAAYHAGMDDAARKRAQESFMSSRAQMIVATNAFGMGIDKPDIRFVAHYQMPGSIEAYYQEIGRAGRDGLPSTCALLFNYADKRTQDYFIEGSYPPPELIQQVYRALAGAGPQRIEMSIQEIAARAGVRNEMAVNSALIILEKAGHIERGASSENRALLRLLVGADEARQAVMARQSAEMQQALSGLLGGYELNQRFDTELDINELAQAAALDPPAARRALRQMAAAGIISYTLARRTRGVALLDERPVNQLRIRPHEIARRAALEQRKLREMINFCYTERCYRAFILDYFGDRHHAARCGTCGNCAGGTGAPRARARLDPPTELDRFVTEHRPFALTLDDELDQRSRAWAAREAAERPPARSDAAPAGAPPRPLSDDERLRVRKILACAARMQGRFGKHLLAATLRGSRSGKILEAGLNQLSTYGILRDMTQEEILIYIDALIAAGCLTVASGAYPTVALSPFGGQVMRDRASLQLALALEGPRKQTAAPTGAGPGVPGTREPHTVDATYALYREGLSIEEIARRRALAVETVEKHLAECIAEGREFDLSRHVSEADRVLIEQAIAQIGAKRLRPLRDALPSHISYRMIRFVVAAQQRS